MDLLEKTSYEAIDFRDFIYDFWQIKQRAKSLNKKDRSRLLLRVDFLETELRDFEKFQKEICEEISNRRKIIITTLAKC